MDTPPPERELVTFPATNHFDIAHQILKKISGEQLLQSYLRQRAPSPLLNWAPNGDIQIISRRIWQVFGMVLDRGLQDVLPDLRYGQMLLGHGHARWMFEEDDDPEALSYLLCWMHSSQPFEAVPLRGLREWRRIIRLWKIAHKYSAHAVKDDIAAIILASRLSGQGTARIFVEIVHIIMESDQKFVLQATHFMKALMRRSITRLSIGLLDEAMRLVVSLRENELEEMELTEKVAHRNYFCFYWTDSLLRPTSSFDVERPEDWQYVLDIWHVAKKYQSMILLQHLQTLILFEMSLKDVQDPESIIAVMDVFLDRTDAEDDNILRSRFFDKVVEESYRVLTSQPFRLYASSKHKLALFDALLRRG